MVHFYLHLLTKSDRTQVIDNFAKYCIVGVESLMSVELNTQ